jgi:flagellar motor switch protein FliM
MHAVERAPVLGADREVQASLPLLDESLRAASRRVRTRMLGRSGTDTPIRIASIRPMILAEILDLPEVRDAAAWSGFVVERLDASGFTVIESRLLDRLVGRLFGEIDPGDRPTPGPRTATEVELKVATRLCSELYSAIEAHWPSRPAPRFRALRAVSSGRAGTDVGAATSMVAVSLEFGNEVESLGTLTLALPVMLLRGLAATPEATDAVSPAPARAARVERVLPIPVEVVVELSRMRMSLRELRELRVGDQLSLPPCREAVASINGRPTLAGEAGQRDGVRCIRVGRKFGGG